MRIARDRRVYIGLLVAAIAFFFLGELGGKNGNPSWLLTPVCLLIMVVLGLIALLGRRRNRSHVR